MEDYFKGDGHMIYKVPEVGILFYIREEYPTDEVVIREIFEEDVYEVDPSRITPGGVVLDIGANIGSFSLFAAKHMALVYAIEPEPNNLNALRKNVELNNMSDSIVIVPLALGKNKNRVRITNEGGGSTTKESKLDGSIVDQVTLDDIFSTYNIKAVDVLKMDVEGSELDIISATSKENMNKCRYITLEFDVRVGLRMGEIVTKLSETHHVRTMGSWERGGMIWAWLY
jgi:FkbM family methyltransferase